MQEAELPSKSVAVAVTSMIVFTSAAEMQGKHESHVRFQGSDNLKNKVARKKKLKQKKKTVAVSG